MFFGFSDIYGLLPDPQILWPICSQFSKFITPAETTHKVKNLSKDVSDLQFNYLDLLDNNNHNKKQLCTSIHEAIRNNNLREVRDLSFNFSKEMLNTLDVKHTLPLKYAIEGHTQSNPNALSIIETLLQRGADVNLASKKDDDSFLHLATKNDSIPLTRLLLEYGAEKYYKYTYDQMLIENHPFSQKEERIYKIAKSEILESRFAFYLGFEDSNSPISTLSKDLIILIFTTSKVSNAYQEKISELQRKMIIRFGY